MRLTDVDVVVEALDEALKEEEQTSTIEQILRMRILVDFTKQVLSDAPTVDAVKVVRCKNCKHSEHWYADKSRCFLWSEAGIDVFEDGYCSYGKRREDGETD